MTINRNATAAGKKFESDLVKYLRESNVEADRLHLSGSADEGDIIFRTDRQRFIVEAKRTKTLDLAGWVKQAEVERDNWVNHRGYGGLAPAAYDLPGFMVVHYARGKGISQSYVTTTLSEFLGWDL